MEHVPPILKQVPQKKISGDMTRSGKYNDEHEGYPKEASHAHFVVQQAIKKQYGSARDAKLPGKADSTLDFGLILK
jgi:hypothetical protein